MIANFLNEFKDKLEKYQLESIKIKATPISKIENLLFTQSKFLGRPYLPISMQYPKDKLGNPMILLAQINFAEMPHLVNYPKVGILQFFVSPTNWYNMDDYKIFFHENIEDNSQKDFSFLTEKLYKQSPIKCEHKLYFEKILEYGGYADFRFDIDFNGETYYDYQEKLTDEQKNEMNKFFEATGHKIGGYAYFVQSDIRQENENLKEDVLLLQIDTDEKIMFGDSGIASLFINPKSLKNKDFSKAWFNWDCY